MLIGPRSASQDRGWARRGSLRALPDDLGRWSDSGRSWAGAGRAGPVRGGCGTGGRTGQPGGGRADLADDLPDDAQGRARLSGRCRAPPQGAGSDLDHQLAGEAVHHGRARVPVLPVRVRRSGSGGRSRGVHRRDDPVGSGTVHRNGVRLEPADQRESELHAGPGLDQRPDPGVRVRADRRVPPGGHRSDGALGNTGRVRRDLRRGAARGGVADSFVVAAARWAGRGRSTSRAG